MTEPANNSRRGPSLAVALRAMGLLDICAFAAAIAPRAWIAASHEALGLGSFPHEPIAGYLARCTSVWCGLYGLLLWFVAGDVTRYARLITVLACAMIAQGLALMAIDFAEGMPGWWTSTEGPCCSVLGVVLLTLQRRADLSTPTRSVSEELRSSTGWDTIFESRPHRSRVGGTMIDH